MEGDAGEGRGKIRRSDRMRSLRNRYSLYPWNGPMQPGGLPRDARPTTSVSQSFFLAAPTLNLHQIRGEAA